MLSIVPLVKASHRFGKRGVLAAMLLVQGALFLGLFFVPARLYLVQARELLAARVV